MQSPVEKKFKDITQYMFMMNNSLMVDLMAGMVGGAASVFVGQPLDTIKVKMQLFPGMYKGMLSCLMKTARQQGLRGLYAGTVPALASNCSENAVLFGTYGLCQKIVANMAGIGSDTTNLNYMKNAEAGFMASWFTSLVLCPTELVKIRMQCFNDDVTKEVKQQKPSINQVVKNIWRTDGIRGLFRGLGSTIARENIGCFVFFGSYEWTREKLKPVGGRKENCDSLATMTAGALAGTLMWLVIYPIDVIKSRVQMSEKATGFRLLLEEARSIGLRGLYSGLWPTLMKTLPVTAVLLFSVEFSKPFFRNYLPSPVSATANAGGASVYEVFSFCDFISGWIAGIVSTCVGHPMDTVRVIQQVTNTNAIKATRLVYEQNKFAGYFRGMMFPILTTGVVNSVFFGIYGNTMRLIRTYRSEDVTKIDADVRFCCEAEHLNKYWHFDVFVSGSIAGFCFTIINIPNEVVKTMLQASNAMTLKSNGLKNTEKTAPPKITSSTKLIIELYKIHGIKSMYRSGTLLLLRDVPSLGVYMLVYEHLSCILKQVIEISTDTKTEPMPKFAQLIAGGLAGVTSWILVLPLDVIKSKIVADSLTNPVYSGSWDCIKKTYRQGGSRSFFQGFTLLCLRAFPVNGIAFLMYEILLDTCTNKKPTKQVANSLMMSRWS